MEVRKYKMGDVKITKKKSIDNKRYFRCPDELWQKFDEVIKADNIYKDKSDCLRNLIKNYIKENEK